MAENPTEKCCYPSQRGGQWVTAAQFIVEELCVKIAAAKQVDLPERFWQLPEWSKVFRRHVRDANNLLKKHDANLIMKVMRNPLLYKMQTFNFPPFLKILREESEKWKTEVEKVSPQSTNYTIPQPQNIPKKPSLLARLKENE